MDESRNSTIKITKKAVTNFPSNNQKRTYFTKVLGFQKQHKISKSKANGFQLKRFLYNLIKPIKPSNFDFCLKPFATMDVETMDYQEAQQESPCRPSRA